MATADRPLLLESLDERHDQLLEQLAALDARVEAALAACGVTPVKSHGGEQKAAVA